MVVTYDMDELKSEYLDYREQVSSNHVTDDIVIEAYLIAMLDIESLVPNWLIIQWIEQ